MGILKPDEVQNNMPNLPDELHEEETRENVAAAQSPALPPPGKAMPLEEAVEHVLTKNKELYRRLAK